MHWRVSLADKGQWLLKQKLYLLILISCDPTGTNAYVASKRSGTKPRQILVPYLDRLIFTSPMPTNLPYAADAEMALTFDELEVCTVLALTLLLAEVACQNIDPATTIFKRGRTRSHNCPNKVQLCLGPREKPCSC